MPTTNRLLHQSLVDYSVEAFRKAQQAIVWPTSGSQRVFWLLEMYLRSGCDRLIGLGAYPYLEKAISHQQRDSYEADRD